MYRFLPLNFIQIPTYADSYKFLHFGVEITTSKKNPISHIIQNHWKTQLYYELFSFNLTVKYIQLHNVCLWNCLWTRNAYRLAVRKVFLFQMLGDTHIFTLPGKVSLWQKFQNDVLFGNMNMDSPLTYWNSNSSSRYLFYNDCLDLCWFLIVRRWNDIASQTGLSIHFS